METNKENYHFASNSIEDFMNDYHQPKIEAVDNSAELDLFEKMNTINAEQEEQQQQQAAKPLDKVTKSVAQSAAKSAAGFLEMVSDIGNGFIDKSEENRLTDYERENLEDSLETYFLTYGIIDIPPGWMLAFTIAMIFAPKTLNAVHRRKERQKIEKQQAEIEKLRTKLEMYEKTEKNE